MSNPSAACEPATGSTSGGADTDRPSGLTNTEILRGMRSWTVSSALAAVYSAITTGAYNTGYALHLGATTSQVGLLSAASSWGQTLQLLSPLVIERLQRRRFICLAAFLFSYALWAPIALLPWLVPPSARPLAMIVLVAMAGAAAATAQPASTSWLGDLVPDRLRARFVSRQQMAVAAVGLLASLLAGRYMDAFPSSVEQTGFTTLFLTAVAFGASAIVVWGRVPEPPRPKPQRLTLPGLFLLPLGNTNFRSLTLFVAVRSAAVMIAAPFFVVYMLRHLGIPYSLIAAFSGLSTVATIVANPFWAYLADKFGYRPVLQISAFGLGFVPVVWFFTTRGNYFVVTPLLMLWAGAMAAGVILAQFNLLIKLAPQEHRSAYVGFHSAVVSAASALGAMAGGALAELFEEVGPLELNRMGITPLHYVFAVSAVGRFGCLILLRQVGEERASSARTLIARLQSGHPLAAVWGLYRMAHARDPASKAESVRTLGSAHSRLAVEELIASLDDSDRNVRREAARALGEVGDARAVRPLIQKAQDDVSGISLDAIEALGHIHTPETVAFLIRMLDSEQPAVREAAAVALGTLADPVAAEPLRRLLTRERYPTVTLAAARALGRTAGPEALDLLRELLRNASSDVARRELATVLGDLISRPGRLYQLLQSDSMRQEEVVERTLRRCRARLAHLRGISEADAHYAANELQEAFEAFARGDYGSMPRILLQVATRAMKLELEETTSLAQSAQSVRELLQDERLGVSYSLLAAMAHDARFHPLTREEALLAMLAFQVLIHRLGQMEHTPL